MIEAQETIFGQLQKLVGVKATAASAPIEAISRNIQGRTLFLRERMCVLGFLP